MIEVKGKNIYYIDNKTAEIDLELGGEPRAVIDIEDIMFAMEHKWQLYRHRVITRGTYKRILPLTRYLLELKDPNMFAVHADGNKFNCRRNNIVIIPRGQLSKYVPLAKRNIIGQTRVKAEDIPETSTNGLSYNTSAPIGYRFGEVLPLEYIGDGLYLCSVPATMYIGNRFVKTSGMKRLTITELYSQIKHMWGIRYKKGHPKENVYINYNTLFKGKELIADLKPMKFHAFVEKYKPPEPEFWYESGDYVVESERGERVVDKKWIENHIDPVLWGEGGI